MAAEYCACCEHYKEKFGDTYVCEQQLTVGNESIRLSRIGGEDTWDPCPIQYWFLTDQDMKEFHGEEKTVKQEYVKRALALLDKLK